jgi:23S rRNA pseudouridine1911/1915/1917 synthase
MQSLSFKVEAADGPRLDQYLTAQNVAVSRSQIAAWIKEGLVTLNGAPAKASARLKEGDVVSVTLPTLKPTQLKPEAISLDILYEDDDLIVLNKAAQMVVHPGAGHETGTLVHALLSHCKGISQIGGVERPGIVHRLDKGTSGVMVIAKNDETHLHLSNQFKDHQVEKIYWTIVYGVPKDAEGTFQSLIARSPVHRKKFTVHEKKGKEAVTHYEVLKEGNGLSLLEVRLETGRTHQIRVHLTESGHSLVGDPLYGGHSKRMKQIRNDDLRRFVSALDHPLLHAKSLAFAHPTTGKPMQWMAPIPKDFNRTIELSF